MSTLRAMIELQRPSIELVSSFLASVAEMDDLGETIWDSMKLRASETPALFVDRLLRAEYSPEPGRVPESVYWAVVDGVVVGRIALRHQLNDELEQFGGYIGYEVRPSVRRKGVGREMLRQLLEIPKAKQIGRILLTCAPDNVGSKKLIVANGGVLARTAFVTKWQRQTDYYWIELR